MARRIEDIDPTAVIIKLEHRTRDRDTALLLDLHPVRHRMTLRLARLDGAREMDCAAIEQEFLRERRLTGVRMRNNREGTSLLDFPAKFFL